jgi:hypothetical protein
VWVSGLNASPTKFLLVRWPCRNLSRDKPNISTLSKAKIIRVRRGPLAPIRRRRRLSVTFEFAPRARRLRNRAMCMNEAITRFRGGIMRRLGRLNSRPAGIEQLLTRNLSTFHRVGNSVSYQPRRSRHTKARPPTPPADSIGAQLFQSCSAFVVCEL